MRVDTKKIAYVGVFTALALIAFLIENLLPPLFIPGARLGLGNVFLMLTLVLYSLPEALLMLAAKCILAAIFGGASALLFSVAAGLSSLVVTYLFFKFFSERLSVTAIAAVAATVNNLVQLSVFALYTRSTAVFYYAPYLALTGVAAGVITGLTAYFILRYFPFEKRFKQK